MAIDLVVPKNTSVILNAEPQDALKAQMKRLNIQTFGDLAAQKVVASASTIDRMLTAAKKVTQEALTRRETFTPFRPIPGTARTDLQRFGGFMAALPSEHPMEVKIFWLVARSIEPTKLQQIDKDTPIQAFLDIGSRLALAKFVMFLFQDITVESGATLEIQKSVKILAANNVLIKRTGRIVVKGTGTTIKAFSIKGEQ